MALETGSANTDSIIAQHGGGTDFAAGLAWACTAARKPGRYALVEEGWGSSHSSTPATGHA